MIQAAEIVETTTMEEERNNRKKIGFYKTIRGTLLTARIGGILLISGLLQGDSGQTRFTWKSTYTLVYATLIVIQFFKLVLFGHGTFNEKFSVDKLSPVFLALLTSTTTIVLIPFCYTWSKMINKINDIEKSLPPIKKSVVTKINLFMVVMICGGLVEHILHVIYSISVVQTCHLLSEDSGLHYKSYIMYSLSWVYNLVPFDYFTASILMIAKLQTTFIWNFIDVFIMIISLYLIIRFQEFNKLFEEKEQELSSSTGKRKLPWPELRCQYTKLMKLVGTLDRYINPLVFISYSNLFFIGKQIYLLINKKLNQTIHKQSCYNHNVFIIMLIYYFFSVCFLMLRAVLVCYLGARVHSLSRKPLDYLHTIPPAAYDYNFQRFMDQVFHANVSLSGLRCFFVTRETVLAMFSALLTFELMLFQNRHHQNTPAG